MKVKCIDDRMAKDVLKVGQIYKLDPARDIIEPYRDGRKYYIIGQSNFDSKRFVEVQSNANG